MTHPNAIELEAFACGEASKATEAHVDACEACHAFVERARGVARDGAQVVPPAIMEAKRKERARTLFSAARVLAPIAAAAAVVLWLRTPEGVEHTHTMTNPATSTAAPDPPTTAHSPEDTVPTGPSEMTFKGGVQLSVVRRRGESQTRMAGEARIRPGDQLRLEVSIDRESEFGAIIIGDDGSSMELMPTKKRGVGTHLSERSARIDADPLSGTIVVGPKDALERARAKGDFGGAATVRLNWESEP